MFSIFEKTSFACSKIITEAYSTSFTLGIKTLAKRLREPIFGIYGFVRYADEIVDTFHDFDKKYLLEKFKSDTYEAIEIGISLNPVLHAFQSVVNQYKIEKELIDAFLYSMAMDLEYDVYSEKKYEEYIYGSAEVVGLMCLRVFCEGNTELFDSLKSDARSLGAAFQKVNFLRDLKSDFCERGRTYFPGVDFNNFGNEAKKQIEADIQIDFENAYRGIMGLPNGAREGVYLAYIYYLQLFKKIKKTPSSKIQMVRIRVSDGVKMALLAKTLVRGSFNVLF